MPIISPNDSFLMIIDIQERLIKAVPQPEALQRKAEILTQSAALLNVPVIFTEQYPQGLGATLSSLAVANSQTFAKTHFSALKEPEIKTAVWDSHKKQVVICGIETHICVCQTAQELLQNGFEVFVVADAAGSRHDFEHQTALAQLMHEGAHIVSTETVVFDWLESSKNPQFKVVQSLIK